MERKEKIQITPIMSFILFVMIIFSQSKVFAYNNSLMCVDTPWNGQAITGDTNIKGWALNSSGVKSIAILVDGQNLGTAAMGISRPDVAAAYPAYTDGDKSGFSYTLSIGSLTGGSHSITVRATGNDGTINNKVISITVQKPQPLMCVDTPWNGQSITGDTTVKGWALNPSGVKSVYILVDGQNLGTASMGISRPDVAAAYPSYIDGDKSGFSYTLNMASLTGGSHSVTVRETGNDGTIISKIIPITVQKPQPLLCVDTPWNGQSITGDTNVKGWALNPSGVKSVSILVDGQNLGTAAMGLSRPDVAAAYPTYTGGDKSGFSYTLSMASLTGGSHSVTVTEAGYDGTIMNKIISITVQKPQPLMWVDTPWNGQSLTGDTTVKGWALNPSGVKQVDVLVDGQNLGTAAMGLSRPDVAAAYPGYTNGDKSGFSYTLSIASLTGGSHSLTVRETGNDGTIMNKIISITVQKPGPIMYVDVPFNGQALNVDTYIKGWALNPTGVKSVSILVDGQSLGNATIGQSRPDVGAAYPSYIGAAESGFSFILSVNNIQNGRHTLVISAVGNDNTVSQNQMYFFKGLRQTIVIDPGHNFGGDDGAYSTINGITYSERDLNMQLADKLKTKLLDLGYNVIMTRESSDRPTVDLGTSLQNRVDIANNANADLFISIHHDVSSSSSVNGLSAHYSTWRPNIDTDGIITVDGINYDTTPSQAAVKSADLAQKLLDSLSTLGYVNRGKSDHNLFVTRNTNMPSVLLECGFISNPTEAARNADSSEQDKFAAKMAQVIDSFLN